MRISLGFRKAQAFTWLKIMMVIFALGLIFIMLNEPVERIKEITKPNSTGTIYEQPYKKMESAWDMFLIIAVIGILCYGVLSSMRKNNDEEYFQ